MSSGFDRIKPGYIPSRDELRPRRLQGSTRGSLSDREKELGRTFKSACVSYLEHKNSEEPPTYNPIVLNGLFRHICGSRENTSTAMQLKEFYIPASVPLEDFGWSSSDAAELGDKLSFIIKEGRCAQCGDTARVLEGRLVFTKDRPPTAGRMTR